MSQSFAWAWEGPETQAKAVLEVWQQSGRWHQTDRSEGLFQPG